MKFIKFIFGYNSIFFRVIANYNIKICKYQKTPYLCSSFYGYSILWNFLY